MQNRPTPDRVEDVPLGEFPQAMVELSHGDIVIAAITSCTNTANPSLMLAAGLVAKKASERGMTVRPTVKTSLAPGSRVVTEYLDKTGLTRYLDRLGFQTVGYGCTTCIGNSGPLEPHLEKTVTQNDLVVASVLSGNRNFEARVHQNVRANFLMSPPLVVAFALAGTVDIDMNTDPIGKDKFNDDVYLKDLWPTTDEIAEMLSDGERPGSLPASVQGLRRAEPALAGDPVSLGDVYEWDASSTYIREPPYFDKFSLTIPTSAPEITGARPLAIFGDSVTTDHISPAGAIKPSSPAGLYLQQKGVPEEDFNSYGSRRGNDRIMMRGTFANVRIKNLMAPGTEGGVTVHQPEGEQMSIYDASISYQDFARPADDLRRSGIRHRLVPRLGRQRHEPAGRQSRHRPVLRAHPPLQPVGMGVLPCQFKDGVNAQTLGFDGTETFDLTGYENGLSPQMDVTLVIHRASGETEEVPLTLRIDTPIEVDYYLNGGILPYVLRQLLEEDSIKQAGHLLDTLQPRPTASLVRQQEQPRALWRGAFCFLSPLAFR